MENYYQQNLDRFPLFKDRIKEFLDDCRLRILSKIKNQRIKTKSKKSKSARSPEKKSSPNSSGVNSGNVIGKAYKFVDEQERKLLLQKLKEEKKARQAKMKADLEAKSRRLIEEFENQRVSQERLQEKLKEEKLRQLQEMHEIKEKQKKERIEEYEKSNKELKKVSSLKPLFKEIEDRYAVVVELPELENRKKELAKRRQLFNPMNPKEIILHNKNYDQALEVMKIKRKQKFQESKKDEQINSSCQNLYKSKIFEIIKQEEKEQADLAVQKELERRRLLEKSKQYGEIVSELYKPIVKLSTIPEVSSSQSKLKPFNEENSLRKIANRFIIKPAQQNLASARTKTTKASANRIMRKLSVEVQKKDNSFDYLANKRKLRADNESKVNAKNVEWKSILDDESMSPKEKRKKMKSHLKKMEKQTRSYEILAGVWGSLANSQHLTESYLDAIKAKIAYLSELTEE